jgi:hypothetical protein
MRPHTYWLALLTVSVGACSSRADYNPFSVDPEAIADRVRSVALAPLAAGPDVGAPESTLTTLERAITDTLTAAGFAVVSPVIFSGIWESILSDIGGFFDPITGQVIEEKQAIAHQRLTDELSHQFNAGAIVYPELQIVSANYADGVARWDGTSQVVASFWERFAEAVAAAANGFARQPHVSTLPYGSVAAVSLQIIMEDLNGTVMYTNWGGVEIVADEETGKPRSESDLFKDTKRLHRAVGIVLGPLVEQTAIKRAES